MLAALRQSLQRLEPPAFSAEAGSLPLGIPAIDAVLGGGLARGALHEIAARSEAHIAAATGFALGVARGRTVIWIAEDMTLAENGALCGLALDGCGLPPERLLTVTAARHRDLLWAMEEALRCRAVPVVIGETRQAAINAVALRRLSLAAATNGALAVLLRIAPSAEASTAATRWIAGAAASRPAHGPGMPRLDAQLVRNRGGPLGHWMLEWSEHDERFVLASTHPQPVARPAFDRPGRKVA